MDVGRAVSALGWRTTQITWGELSEHVPHQDPGLKSGGSSSSQGTETFVMIMLEIKKRHLLILLGRHYSHSYAFDPYHIATKTVKNK